MSNTFTVNIISPGKEPFVAEIESLKTVSEDGEFEFLANHAAIIISTIPTTTVIRTGEKREKFFTSFGIIYFKDNVLKFCCDAFEKASEIDPIRAETSKKRAEERINKGTNIDIERAKRALARANARLNTIEG
ncbi:ATP synthase delta/epsilon chain alpha-helix domain-containing protein [Caproiciproducens sp. MSJ-32]|uniref:ATP synthase delta/epsilon chain alpha-helix domain-containing protein n=1 Tax=Caproiciproducens sp. MSJ-32 TaxID=2841527 RepID=UPI001C1164F5|nr:ATP synthase delta/epsilon chain alpha-helix domain-containing protein [Caproiciproducens sp. MSJ-32]MBU5454348.1 F0F1 ATP synthase subunit epsilon [Caproiciproducens sp. MSJ-32]